MFLNEALYKIFQITGKSLTLKDEQKEAVKSLLSGRDVLAILPTGFGKSLIFQLFAIAKSIEAAPARALFLSFVLWIVL